MRKSKSFLSFAVNAILFLAVLCLLTKYCVFIAFFVALYFTVQIFRGMR